MKHASLAAAVLAVIALNACKTVPPAAPPNVACQNEPRWFKTDASGKPTIAIFECFRADNVVSYVAHQLTSEEAAKYQLAAAATAPAPTAAESADPCSELHGKAYTDCRLDQSSKRHPAVLKPAPGAPAGADKTKPKAKPKKKSAEQETIDAKLKALEAEAADNVARLKRAQRVQDEKEKQMAAADRAAKAGANP